MISRAPPRPPALDASARAVHLRPGGTVGRYLLASLVRPFVATLLIVLPALLLERLLRLFGLVATQDVPAASVMRMLVDLIPFYLGLALPAAFFIGIYFVVARLDAGREIDAMRNAGFSLTWIGRPFMLMGVFVALGGFGLYGYAQPYTRYAYRAAFLAATTGSWNGTIPPGEITRVSRNLLVTTDRSDPVTGRLEHVFIYQHQADGGEKITVAPDGRLLLSPDRTELLLELAHPEQMERAANGKTTMLSSSSTTVRRPFVLALSGFRPRGLDEREMTIGELWSARRQAHPAVPRRVLDGELHSRIVRSLSLAILPLLAIPFGLSGQRSGRPYRVVAGVLILVLYYHTLQLAQSFGIAMRIDPRPLLWGALVVFGAASVGIFRRAEMHGGDGLVDRLSETIEAALHVVVSNVRRRLQPERGA